MVEVTREPMRVLSLEQVHLTGIVNLLPTRWAGGAMAPSWPEHKPADATKSHEELHPLLYSLDTFLPVVDLHQENYWWPDATASGSVDVFGLRITISGRLLRHYLWLQIIAGWLLSAIFIAGVTGLLRND